MSNTIFTKENLIELLQNNIVTVTFTKANGEERVMQCTLLAEYVPNTASSSGRMLLNEENNGYAGNLAVWDTQAGGWRSFRIDSIKNVSVG